MKTISALFSLSLFAVALVAAQNADAAVPIVDNATMAQSDTSRQVTITYTLANAPAVVNDELIKVPQTLPGEGMN